MKKQLVNAGFTCWQDAYHWFGDNPENRIYLNEKSYYFSAHGTLIQDGWGDIAIPKNVYNQYADMQIEVEVNWREHIGKGLWLIQADINRLVLCVQTYVTTANNRAYVLKDGTYLYSPLTETNPSFRPATTQEVLDHFKPNIWELRDEDN